ncbi:GH92 family glycosyl hydrolase [Oerskovia sp. Root22]|uniref:GH92 family glycosyl hydrolase n=1 Tax=Oerskovia sp. Root22 TaxID=1736494 RepID=UPI0009E9F3D4|nr:GH92 family glycosyl hydrolase [Oerskovia sp. Root22]
MTPRQHATTRSKQHRRSPIPSTALALALLVGAAPAATAIPAAGAAPAAAPTAVQAEVGPVDQPLVSYVNPFIGTKDDGNTYPGASVPFGMVQFSPDNGHNVGYDYGRDRIRGFSLVHLSGVGCGLGGTLPVLPTTGDVTSTDYGQYALKYSHDDEEASPGYYRVGLQASAGTIDAELTAGEHTAVQRYTFPSTDKANVLINTGQALNRVTGSTVTVIDDRTVETTITQRGFCQDTQPFTIHTRTTFDRPFTTYGTWQGGAVTAGAATATGDGRVGAYLRFDTTGGDLDVEATTSMSYVDAAGAAANLDAEEGTFDEARTAATAAWEERLGSVAVQRGAEDDLRTFYSSLYRSFLAPNTGTDVDGRYRGWDQEVHVAEDFTYYQNFSLWDTYRTQQQLLALLAPQESQDMALSVVRAAEQGGWLPRWGYGTVETNIMTGDPATPFLVSAWSQGLLAGHEEEAYAVLQQSADNMAPADSPFNGRAGNDTYLASGFVPHEPGRSGKPGDYDLQHGGSATLEYALSDAMLATMARGLGHDEDADRYAVRGQNYRSVFDPRTGAFRARNADGLFVGDPDPAKSDGFHEGTAVQYQWLVQQDVPGLVDLIGGTDPANEALDSFFAYDQLLVDPEKTAREVWVNGTYSYYDQDTYNPNNEPNLHAPYVYLWTGQPWKTNDVVRAALTLFTDGPDGVTGNDDLGTMSAWHVLSGLGIYPIVPGTDTWGLSTPLFDDVRIDLDESFYPRSELHITAPGTSTENRYTASVTAGATAVDRAYLTGPELTAAGTLSFATSAEHTAWATGPDAAPGAVDRVDAEVSRLFAGLSTAHPVIRPGATVDLVASVVAQGPGTVSGEIQVTGSDAVQVQDGSGPWSVVSDGLPATSEIPLRLSAAPGVAPGAYPVTVVVTDAAGHEVSREVTVVVAQESWLRSSFDNAGIGDAGAANANFDGQGAYLLRDLLAEQGAVQGVPGLVPGTQLGYVLAAEEPGAPDNVRANGQVLDVRASIGTARQVSLVGSSNNGTHGGDLVLGFTDGTSQTSRVELSDWCTGSPVAGNILVAKAGARGSGTGTQRIGCGLYATAPVAVPEGKALATITLPRATNMHVFAVASDAVVVGPAFDVVVSARAQCVAGRVVVSVRAVSAEELPVDVKVTSAFGSRSFVGLAPGKSASASFATRSGAVEAGQVTVVVSQDGRSQEVVASYDATTCD